MRVLIAFDKLKEALSAREACEAAARGFRARHPDWRLDLCPLSDGGEGFAEILTRAAGGRTVRFQVSGPRGGLVEAALGLIPLKGVPPAARELLKWAEPGRKAALEGERSAAVVEMAAASGLTLLPPDQRDPWQASTYGTGQLIRAAAELGVGAILLGVGGSATHDLGLGALNALGLEFRGADGAKLRPLVPALWEKWSATEGEVYAAIPPISIACDVASPLLGPRGAAALYSVQKGLRPEDIERLDAAAAAAAAKLCDHFERPRELVREPGTGAAGGIAFGFMAAGRGRLVPGIGLLEAWMDLGARAAAADIVVTGEGRFDEGSKEGKGPGAVAARARALGKPVHVFAGAIGEGIADEPGFTLHAITAPGTPRERALREAAANLAAAVAGTF